MSLFSPCPFPDSPDISLILVDPSISRRILNDHYRHLMDVIRKYYVIIKVSPNHKDVLDGSINKRIKKFHGIATIIQSVANTNDVHTMNKLVFDLELIYMERFKTCPHCLQKFKDQKAIFEHCVPVYE